jgi:hypothetical protein
MNREADGRTSDGWEGAHVNDQALLMAIDGKGPLWQLARVKAHVAACSSCARRVHFLRMFDSYARKIAAPSAVGLTGLRERLAVRLCCASSASSAISDRQGLDLERHSFRGFSDACEYRQPMVSCGVRDDAGGDRRSCRLRATGAAGRRSGVA